MIVSLEIYKIGEMKMGRSFSALHRKEIMGEIADQSYDLLVIGGGITGAGILLDATSRGLQTALIEMQDFAAGTSSRSTKLVHGGLRYLKQLEVKMVAEVGRERSIVYGNGPHVTSPEWMLLPFYEGGTYGKLTASMGLMLYDFLAQVKKSERRTILSVEETITREPLIKQKGLKGSGLYVEYKTDDARLTIEVLKEAVRRGAVVLNYAKAEHFLYDHGRVMGVEALDLIDGNTFEIRATKVVNATGPWVDSLREMDRSKSRKHLQLTKGVHLVFDQRRFPLKQAVYFDTPDGRMVFAIPRDGKAYVGTTDTVYHGELEHPRMTRADRQYLLDAINGMFPSIRVTVADVESSWAGLRPLIYEEGKSPSEISRKDEIWQSPSGLITIAGGKLTGYRKMAETVVNLVTRILREETGKRFSVCTTKNIPISGGEVGGPHHFPEFVQKKASEGTRYGLTLEQSERLAKQYGSNVDHLFSYLELYKRDAGLFGLKPDELAMLLYAVHEEMCLKPADFFLRRNGAIFFDIDYVRKVKERVINAMAYYLHWSPDRKDAYTQELVQRLEEASTSIDD